MVAGRFPQDGGAQQDKGAVELVAQGVDSLPPALTSFVGRHADLTEVADLVAPGRLVTLTGAGGSGKTRLALEVVRGLADQGEDVVFVPLAPLQDAGLVPSAVAVAVGLREEADRALTDVVVDHLASRSLLLVLDNCEHVIEGARALLPRLLHEARQVAVVATSREPLHIPGEQVWPVAPLAVPQQSARPDDVAASPAGRLFLDRARQVRPDFSLTDDTAETVGALCRQLGGLPLAIELIAPWTRALGVQEIAARVDELSRLPVAADGGRHRSIEAALDWSLDLLTEAQQALFRQLAVFAGGFSLDAAEAVAGPGATAVLPTLAELVDKGLVMAEDGVAGRRRYRLLEPVRQYATRLLEASGATREVRASHEDHFARLAERAERHLHVADQVEWLAWLDEDHANLRVAYEGALGSGRSQVALRLAGALWWYWWLRGHVQEGTGRLERALDAAPDASAERAYALVGLAGFLLLTGEYARARGLLDESADIFRALDNVPGLARALGTRGRVEFSSGNLDAGERYTTQALEMYEDLGNTAGVGWLLIVLAGPVGSRGDAERYRELVRRAAAIFDDRGDRWGMGWMNALQANIAFFDGDARRARTFADRALTQFAEIRNRDEGAVFALALRALVLLRLEDFAAAQADVVEAVDLGMRTGDANVLALALTGAAQLLLATGDAVSAAEILGAAISAPTVLNYGQREANEHVMTALRARLDASQLEAALDHGRHHCSPHAVLEAVRALDLEAPTRRAEGSPTRVLGALVQEGELWSARLGEEATRVRDVKGLRYLAHLLAHPGREFHVLDLVAQVEQVPAGEMDRGDAGPQLDAQAKAAYRRRLQDLEEELEAAEALGDDLRAERSRTEREALARELAGAVGLGGRDRLAASNSERARVKVTRLISTAVRKLDEGSCPTLAHLLRSTVRTGTYCAYEPPPDGGPTWSL